MNLPLGILGDGGAGSFNGKDRHNINGAIRVVKYILGIISENRLKELEAKLSELFNKKMKENVNFAISECSGLV